MERIKLYVGDGQTENNIKLESINGFTISNEDLKNYDMSENLKSYINPPENLEKDIYIPKQIYNMNFYFYNNAYSTDFTSKYFIDSDLNKNVFTKSGILLEYLTSSVIETADRYNVNQLSIIYDSRNNRGVSIYKNAIYKVDSADRESYNFYYYRDIVNYSSLFIRAYFLNAKDGNVYNFVNSNDVTMDNITDSSYLYELRIYSDNTYSFFKNNLLVSDLNFYELNL